MPRSPGASAFIVNIVLLRSRGECEQPHLGACSALIPTACQLVILCLAAHLAIAADVSADPGRPGVCGHGSSWIMQSQQAEAVAECTT